MSLLQNFGFIAALIVTTIGSLVGALFLYGLGSGFSEERLEKLVSKYAHFELPKRLWENLVKASGISEDIKWADLSKKQLNALGEQLTNGELELSMQQMQLQAQYFLQ